MHTELCWRAMEEPLPPQDVVMYQILTLLENSTESIEGAASKRSVGNARNTGSAEDFGRMVKLHYSIMVAADVLSHGYNRDGTNYKDVSHVKIIQDYAPVVANSMNYFVYYFLPDTNNRKWKIECFYWELEGTEDGYRTNSVRQLRERNVYKAMNVLHDATREDLSADKRKKTRQVYCIPVTLDAHLELQGIDAKVEKMLDESGPEWSIYTRIPKVETKDVHSKK